MRSGVFLKVFLFVVLECIHPLNLKGEGTCTGVVFSSAFENGQPLNDLKEFRQTDEKFFLITWWKGVPLHKKVHFCLRIHDGKGREVFVNDAYPVVEGNDWYEYWWYQPNWLKDAPGTWKFEVWLDDEKRIERAIVVKRVYRDSLAEWYYAFLSLGIVLCVLIFIISRKNRIPRNPEALKNPILVLDSKAIVTWSFVLLGWLSVVTGIIVFLNRESKLPKGILDEFSSTLSSLPAGSFTTLDPKMRSRLLTEEINKTLSFQKWSEALDLLAESLKLDPESADCWTRLGHTFVQELIFNVATNAPREYADLTLKPSYEDATKALERAVSLNKDQGEAWFVLGNSYGKIGYFDKAENAYKESIKLNYDVENSKKNIGWVHGLRGADRIDHEQYPEAKEELEQAVACGWQDWMTWTFLGFVCVKTGDLTQAEKAYQNALSSTPNKGSVLYDLGKVHFQQGKFGTAIENFRQGQLQGSPMTDISFYIALSAQHMTNYVDAATAYREQLKKDSLDYNSWFNLGAVLEAQTNWVEAVEAYGKAMEIKPDESSAVFGLGKAAFHMQDMAKFKTLLEKLRQIDSVKANQLESLVHEQSEKTSPSL